MKFNLFGYARRKADNKPTPAPHQNKIIGTLPTSQVSRTEMPNQDNYSTLKKSTSFVDRDYVRTLIPVIRKLAIINPDLKIAMKDRRELANTGHNIIFDKNTSDSEQIDMRDHIHFTRKNWSKYLPGIHGITNKLINQASIAGAIAIEWVIKKDLSGIERIVFVDPASIIFRFDKSSQSFTPYQIVQGDMENPEKRYIKLNTNTFMYIALNGDEEIPYGDPEFMAGLNAITSQTKMTGNINFIIQQLGIMGFFEALMEKPGQQANESDSAYASRLTNILTEMKAKLNDSMRDGIIVGYKEDHEFTFHSTTKDLNGVSELFNLNEVQVANGIGHPASFLGVPSNSTDTNFNILFGKLISQLNTIQEALAYVLEYGYSLELRLAGFNFKHLSVVFNKSTITDELKYQQSEEYKIRNQRVLYADGIISQNDYADKMGFESPDKPEPRVEIDPSKILKDAADSKDRNKDKKKSDKSTRDKKNPNPKDNAKNK